MPVLGPQIALGSDPFLRNGSLPKAKRSSSQQRAVVLYTDISIGLITLSFLMSANICTVQNTRYRTYDARGEVLGKMAPQAALICPYISFFSSGYRE